MKEGVYYIALGEDHVEEAKVSAESLKDHNPDIPVAIKTDQEIDSNVFDRVLETSEDFSWKFRISSFKESPFEKTLFLDTDTLILGDLEEVFELLDQFPLAVAQNSGVTQNNFENISNAFPEFNCGVIAYRTTDVQDFLEEWIVQYDESHLHDQPSFRKTLYESDIRFSVLPAEYNCRVATPGSLTSEVKIIHDRLLDFETVGKSKKTNIDDVVSKLTKDDDLRVYWREADKLKVMKNRKPVVNQISDGIQEYGFSGAVDRGVSKILRSLKSE